MSGLRFLVVVLVVGIMAFAYHYLVAMARVLQVVVR
jgi:hypothetical protein